MKKFTVILQYPDYVDNDRGIHTFFVEAKSAGAALVAARGYAIAEEEMDGEEGVDPDDFDCIAIHKGHMRNLYTGG